MVFSSSDDKPIANLGSDRITGQIMVIAMVVLFLAVIFILFIHLYAKWFWWRIEQTTPEVSPRRRSRRRRFVFVPGQDRTVVTLNSGLNPGVLRKIPLIVFNTQKFKDGLECAVCLCELEDGEKARLLPNCNHGFHVECIDMWFQSHSTCPICRNPVDDDVNNESEVKEIIDIQDSQESSESGQSSESSSSPSPNFPTNVLFWGNETLVSSRGACLQEDASSSSSSTSSSGELVVDIPARNMNENLSSMAPDEESKSPMTTRLRSLKRLLSRDKRASPYSSGSGNGTSSSCDVV